MSATCCSCQLCFKSCPSNAIKMVEEYGFKHAYIDEEQCNNCGLCQSLCPMLREFPQNKIEKKMLLKLKDNKLIDMSSSGGVFGELSRWIINQKGVVYGAAFNTKFNVEFIRVADRNNLYKVFRSKYVHSDISLIFENIKKDLDANKKVLLGATPCQIAAVKLFLRKEYPNLFSIDLICHGLPSSLLWEKYTNYLSKKGKIKDVNFRYNNKKAPEKNFLVLYEANKKYNETLYKDPYGYAFLNNIILNESCYKCNFKNSRSCADLTIGDAHGYNLQKAESKHSLVIVNTKNGEFLLKNVMPKFNNFIEFDITFELKNNYPILHPSPKHFNREYILQNINNKTIIQLLNDAKKSNIEKNSKNVGILNFFYENYNYGANLVAYSLSKVVEKLGYKPYIINFDPFPPLDSITRYRTQAFLDFRQDYLNLTPLYTSSSFLNETNDYIDSFIVGSDQVWRKTITKNNLKTYFLDFVNWNKNCISYGASYGTNKFEGNYNEINDCKLLLKKFSNVSVREKDAINITKELFDANSCLVLDPTLLLTKEDYNTLILKENVTNKKGHIAIYTLFDQDENFNKELKRLFPNKEILNIKTHSEYIPLLDRKELVYNSIPNWINEIKNADYIVTDSYHGLLFSLIFEKDFICLGKNSSAKSRFDSLSELLGGNISSRIIGSLSDVNTISTLIKLNYNDINKNIQNEREKSLKFIKGSLNFKKSNNKYIDIIERYNKLNKDLIAKIEDLELNCKSLKQEIEVITIQNQDIIKNNQEITKNNQELIKDNQKLNNYLYVAQHQINDMIYSKSWRITMPLRKVRNLLSKVKK